MQRTTGLATIAAIALMGFPALASARGTMEDQLACTPDVYRLCSQYIPDEDTIVKCLQQNVSRLSPACHKVFTEGEGKPKKDNEDD